MLFDRAWAIFRVVVYVVICPILSIPHCEVCLGAFITLHLVSIALRYDLDRWECYAVRTILPWIISGLLCSMVLWGPMILHDEIPTIFPVCMILLFCGFYAGLFTWFYSKLHGYQLFRSVYDPFQTRWFNIFTDMRMLLMWLDRVFDLFVVVLFVANHSESAPDWDVCLGVYVTSRLLSFIVCCGTSLCKCYIFRTVLLHAASGFCCAAVLAPFIAELSDGWFVILPVCFLVMYRAIYLCLFICIRIDCSECESD